MPGHEPTREVFMRPVLARTLALTAVLLLCTAGAPPLRAGEKPLLSAEIKQVLEGQGAEAAQRRFDELFPSQKEGYEVDIQGFAEMAAEVMQGGDMETGQVIMQMVATLTQDAVQSGAALSGVPSREPPKAEEEPEPGQAPNLDRGPPRNDLERFVGLYSDPAKPDKLRSLFAAVSCDGYLVVGATWGDASNWWMRSAGDAVFEYEDSFTQLHLEFQSDKGGKAVAMRHDLEFMPNPLKRIGPLPEDWAGDCIERPLR